MKKHIAVFNKKKKKWDLPSKKKACITWSTKFLDHFPVGKQLNHQVNTCSSDSKRLPLHPSIIHMISHIQIQCSEPGCDLADSGPTKSHRRNNNKKKKPVAGPKLQGTERAVCGGRGSPIDGHKESIGSVESLRESSWGSVGRVALNRIILSPLVLTSVGQ